MNSVMELNEEDSRLMDMRIDRARGSRPRQELNVVHGVSEVSGVHVINSTLQQLTSYI